MLALILAQAVTALAPLDFDLGHVRSPSPDCPGATGTGIVVCARRRAGKPAVIVEPEADALPKAEFGLFGKVRGSLHSEGVTIGGAPSNRVMATVKIPF